MNIACVYIAPPPSQVKYKPFIERFLASYQKFTPKMDHRLIIALKDWPAETLVENPLTKYCCFTDKNEGFDIGSYIRAAKSFSDSTYFVGLSAYAEFKCSNWLESMHNAINQDKVGLVGATGSWERGAAGKEFPNYHIRTSCFMIRTELFNSFNFEEPKTKEEMWEFEHGPNSLTKRVMAKGLRCVVVGKDGVVFDKEEWLNSYTFRHGTQDNLICGDNHTDDYINSVPRVQAERYAEAFLGRGI